MRKKFLPFSLPRIGEKEKKEILDSLDSGWITTGPKAIEFEEKVAEYVGSKYAIAMSSCTAALHISLVALRIEEKAEVITSPFTFCSTINVIMHQKAKPIFVDIRKDTFNIDENKIEEKITSK
ncbi:MAG: DegT/DnrJ/EryC1/StrS family aminotransferase, partial [Candidatus Hodarchaeota archaeon]